MKRTLTFISVFALMISMLALPATAVVPVDGTASTPVSDGGVTPYIIPGENPGGNRTCAEVGAAYFEDNEYYEFSTARINFEGGTFDQNFPGGLIVVTDGTYVSFSSSFPIGAAIVKGTAEANTYVYEPQVLSDGGLASPPAGSGEPAGLSNITFCWNDEPFTPDGAVDLDKDATASFDVDVDWDLDKKVRQRGRGFNNSDFTDDLELFGEPGDRFLLVWRLMATRTDGAPYNHTVSGEITVSNSSTNTVVTVDLADELSKEGVKVGDATVDCGDGTASVAVAAGKEETCSYTATEAVAKKLPDLNTVSGTATATDPEGFEDHFQIEDATADVMFTTNFIGETSPVLADPEFGFRETITATTNTGTTDERFRDVWVCPPERSAEYDEDGIYVKTLTNTATLNGEGLTLEDSAKVTLTCYDDVFEGETAWAANGDKSGELRYNQRGGNWATFVEYSDEGKTTTLFAGQTINVGSVTFSVPVDEMVTITVLLSGDWEFEDVAENLKVQDYADAPSGNPAPGRFDHKKDCDAASKTCSIVVPENDYYGVHVNVGQWVPNPLLPS